jgi:hypothetical protein
LSHSIKIYINELQGERQINSPISEQERTIMHQTEIDKKNKDEVRYAATIGILQSNSHIEMAPGDVGNARTFKFPVVYRIVDELTSDRLIVQADPTLEGPLIREARALEELGVAAITGDCGHLIQFQNEVATAVNIPVFLSSWMQVPYISRIIPSHQRIGVLMANSRHLRRAFLKRAGIDESIPMAVAGMEDQPAFRSAIIEESGELDSAKVEKEIVTVAQKLKQEYPDIGAIFLECSDMPPYAAAIQDVLHLPVFDFVTMINFVHATLTRARFDAAE